MHTVSMDVDIYSKKLNGSNSFNGCFEFVSFNVISHNLKNGGIQSNHLIIYQGVAFDSIYSKNITAIVLFMVYIKLFNLEI